MPKQKSDPVVPVSANAPASTVVVDFSQYLVSRSPPPDEPPIDQYYKRARAILVENGATWCTDWHRQLFVVHLVGLAEVYARNVLATLVRICPGTERTALRKQLSLGSVGYYSTGDHAFGILDHQALSGCAEICRATAQIADFDIKQNSSAYAALEGFDRVCQLRHAIVHQCGGLAPHNLLEFNGLTLPDKPVDVSVSQLRMQDLVAVVHSAVRALNQFILDQTLRRWVRMGLVSVWANDRDRFEAICRLLISKEDCPTTTAESLYTAVGGTIV